VAISEEIREAVRDADLFLMGPGSLFTSILPNLVLVGLMEEVRKNGSPMVYIGNMMTQPGETDGFGLSHHIRAIRRHAGPSCPDAVVAQTGDLPAPIVEKYGAGKAIPVALDLDKYPEFDGIRVIARNFYSGGDVVRHDPDVLARTIHEEFLVAAVGGASGEKIEASKLGGSAAGRSGGKGRPG
jgi:uncharacterized cofD-like protein